MPIKNTTASLLTKASNILLVLCALCLSGAVSFPSYAQSETRRAPCRRVYMMSYFTTAHEALHLAYSCDGYIWATVNSGQPIIRSRVSTGSMRDPSILPDPNNGSFHLIWTDGWNSTGIGYAHSDDLLTWDEQRVLPLMAEVEHTKNMWAPEIFFDEQAGEFRLIWSSTVHDTEVQRFLNAWNHRIWTATTTDFRTFSKPEKFFDPGYPVIDANLTYHDGNYVLIYKDERGDNKHGTDNKAMRVASAEAITGPFEIEDGFVTAHLTEGPTVFPVADQWLMFYDHFMDGHFGASISADLYQWEVVTDQIVFPPRPRHATVFRVPFATFERLYAHWS